MLRPRVIPVLLYAGTGLVKSVRFKNHRYVGDVLNAVRIFNEKEVDELVLLDINASREGRPPDLTLIRDVAGECFMPLAYGGGISSIAEMQSIFTLGVEKVIVNTAAVQTPNLVRSAADAFGSQSVVVSIDVKKRLLGNYEVVSCGGVKATGLNPVDYASRVASSGAGEVIVNSVDRDGTMGGYDLSLIADVSAALRIPLIACGGAGSLADLSSALAAGASAAAAGSLFVFHGRHRAVLISYPSAREIEALSTEHEHNAR